MNEKYAFLYKIKSDQTICLYRVYANSAHISIPETVDGYAVTEIANYCFSQNKSQNEKLICSAPIDSLYEIAEAQVESIVFPDSVKKLGSFVFYNCKKLSSLSFGPACTEIGSDIFINCHSLQDIYIRTHVDQPTILKQMLTQISWDIDIHFMDRSLFYSEYYEMYDEIGPAHIFGLNISGEGFRLRQCFKNGIVDLQEYAKTFEKLRIEESKESLSHFILYQYEYEPALYATYIMENASYFSNYLLENTHLEESKKIDLFALLLQNKLITKEQLSYLITSASNAHQIERTTKLIELKKQYFSSKKTYDFEDF